MTVQQTSYSPATENKLVYHPVRGLKKVEVKYSNIDHSGIIPINVHKDQYFIVIMCIRRTKEDLVTVSGLFLISSINNV